MTQRNISPELAIEVVRIHDQLRRHKADLHKINCSPIPSGLAKSRAREQISALAARGCPDCFGLIEVGEPIRWPKDPLALIAWLFEEQLLAAINREIDACADDEHALDPAEVQKRVDDLTKVIAGLEKDLEKALDRLYQ